jgi:hypothetical protein
MGATAPDPNQERERKIRYYRSKQFFSAYESIKDVLMKLYEKKIEDNENNEKKEFYYLIDTKSEPISDFFNFIENRKDNNDNNECFNNINNEDKQTELENKLKKKFEEYKLIKGNITIYSNYKQCEEVIKNTNDKDNDNEFIIVNEIFLKNFEIKNAKYSFIKINKIYNDENDKLEIEIKFRITEDIINSREKVNKKGFFEFYKKEENKGKKNKLIIDNKVKEKEEKIYYSMFKNLCNSLIKINILNYAFLSCGDIIKENKKISRIIFNLIQQRNMNCKLEYSKLDEIIKLNKLDKIEKIIGYLYEEMHNELRNANNDSSIIKSIFYYQLIISYNCKNCPCKSYEKQIRNYIKFPLSNILNIKEKKYQLDLFGCFDYIKNDNSQHCNKCGGDSKIESYKFNYINDILTIILDFEKAPNIEISFKLNFNNIDLKKYFYESTKCNCEFELIGFCSYFRNENKYISYTKNQIENKWYDINGSYIGQIEKKDCGLPVLQFYKKIYIYNK